MKHIPDEKQMEELLKANLPHPSQRLDQRLSNAPWTLRAVARRRFFNAAAFTILTFSLLIAVTPQGRAFAQKMFLFFTVRDDKSVIVPAGQVFPVSPTVTPVPTYILPLQLIEVSQTEPTQAIGLSCNTPGEQASYLCQIKAAESQAGFNAKEFPLDPKGMEFSKAIFDPAINEINMEFVVSAGGGYLYLRQGMGDFPSPDDWGNISADAIEKVTVNGNYAEQAWESGGPLVLRWREGKLWFSLEKLGDPYPIEWITKQEIIKLAEGLVDDHPTDTVPPLDPEYLKSVEDAEKLAGFDVLAPTLLPQGYELKRVVWADETVRLLYGPKSSNENVLFIFMGPIANSRTGPGSERPPGTDETVQIGVWHGWYWRGIFHADPGIEGQPTPTPVWQANARHWQMVWNTDTLWISMFYIPSNDYGGEMNKETMLKIAESLK